MFPQFGEKRKVELVNKSNVLLVGAENSESGAPPCSMARGGARTFERQNA